MLGRARDLLRPSERSRVPPFMVMDVVAAAARLEARGRRIIHMEVGQPAAGAPATAIAAARDALGAVRLGYTETLGTESLRRRHNDSLKRLDAVLGQARHPQSMPSRIALAYGEWHGIDLDPARIVVTIGSSAGFILAFLAGARLDSHRLAAERRQDVPVRRIARDRHGDAITGIESSRPPIRAAP
jgi:aspartate/methionine/tyrosine aminotransferase